MQPLRRFEQRFLLAGGRQPGQQKVQGGLAPHLCPQVLEGRPPAPDPEGAQRRKGARIAPPVLVVAVAQEGPDPRGQRHAAKLRKRFEARIQIEEGEPLRQLGAGRAGMEVPMRRRGAPAERRPLRLEDSQRARGGDAGVQHGGDGEGALVVAP